MGPILAYDRPGAIKKWVKSCEAAAKHSISVLICLYLFSIKLSPHPPTISSKEYPIIVEENACSSWEGKVAEVW